MIPKRNSELISEFRRERGQDTTPSKRELNVPRTTKNSGSESYNAFLKKFNDLETYIDTFKTRDLVYYFREVANNSGVKYVITNIKKDMAIFKRLQSNYDVREICGMIEFIFTSEQDYIDKKRTSPNVLASSWINSIYPDMQLWVDDKYVPRSKKKFSKKEWTAPKDEDVQIGGW